MKLWNRECLSRTCRTCTGCQWGWPQSKALATGWAIGGVAVNLANVRAPENGSTRNTAARLAKVGLGSGSWRSKGRVWVVMEKDRHVQERCT